MSSLNTNVAAMTALQSLTETNQALTDFLRLSDELLVLVVPDEF